MSFNQRLRLIAFGLLFTLGWTACGHKADPFPPPLENPGRTTDLTVQQRGQAAVLSFSYPTTTVSGGMLEELARVEIYRTRRDLAPSPEPVEDGDRDTEAEDTEVTDAEVSPEEPAADETAEASEPAEPEQPLELLAAADGAEFVATAVAVESFAGEAIDQATEGDRLSFRIELGESVHEQIAYTFAIKTYASEGLVSAFSNLVTLVQRDAPPPPTDFQVVAQASGIELTWAPAEEEDQKPVAFRVYRRSAQSRLYGQPLVRLGADANEHLDRSAAFGERYIYAVTSLSHENPAVESFFGGEREIDYADRFAPKPPTELIALAEAGRVRLLWTASPEQDVVGYVVFRRQAGADFRRLTDEAVVGVEFSDRTVAAATTYDYQVAAVDRSGNQSEPGESVTARVP